MKTNLDLLTKLHYELNLDNFFVANVKQWGVELMGWYSQDMEKILFDKGYQLLWSEELKNFRFESEKIVIVLHYQEL